MADLTYASEVVFPDADGTEELLEEGDGADLPPVELEDEVVPADVEEENQFIPNGVFDAFGVRHGNNVDQMPAYVQGYVPVRAGRSPLRTAPTVRPSQRSGSAVRNGATETGSGGRPLSPVVGSEGCTLIPTAGSGGRTLAPADGSGGSHPRTVRK